MNLWAKYLKEKTKDLQIIVSISKEPHIIYKLSNILVTVQNAERSMNKNKTTTIETTTATIKNIEITNTKHPKQLGEEKTKNPYYAPQVKKLSSPTRKKYCLS